MAKSLVSRPWELDPGEDAQKCVSDNEPLHNALTANLTAIVMKVDLSDNFWTLLLQHGVVNTDTMRRIQAKKTKTLQAQTLMLHIMEVKMYKFHGFIWALVNSHQSHLAEMLGFAVHDYLDEEVYFMSSSLLCPACHEFYTKAYILTGCGHYVCSPCVKGAQFMCKANQKEDVTCPVPECGKITEASPTAGNIGLEEDGDFGILCQAVLKETTKSTGTTNGLSTAVSKEQEGMTATRIEEKENLSQHLQGGIGDLETNISCLRQYQDVLGKYEPGVKEYITDAAEEVKKNVDEWSKNTLEWYTSVCKQVEHNLHKSVKWQKAASELSVVVRARPGLLDECLKDKVNLPEVSVTDAGEYLINKLQAGCPIPPLLTRFQYSFNPSTSIPPTKAKFLLGCAMAGSSWFSKLAWISDCSLMALTYSGLLKLEVNFDTADWTSTSILKTRKATDLCVAADGSKMLCLVNDGFVEIRYPGLDRGKRWKPEGVRYPSYVSVSSRNIFVQEHNSPTIRSYSRELVYVDEYDLGSNDVGRFIHVTERGKLMKSSCANDRKIYTVDLQSKKTSSFSSRQGDEIDGELKSPLGVCTVNDDEYVLVRDIDSDLVSVFTHDGQFIHHLDVNRYGSCGPHQLSYNIAVLDRKGKPSLMAMFVDKGVGIYSLE